MKPTTATAITATEFSILYSHPEENESQYQQTTTIDEEEDIGEKKKQLTNFDSHYVTC